MLLVLKIAFLVLLYLFIWRIVRTIGRDARTPEDSFVLAPAGLGGRGAERPPASTRLVVEKSSILQVGGEFPLDSVGLTVGRGDQNDLALAGDEFASARHVRIEPRRDGVWVHDLGSTNGTYVNGVRIGAPIRLAPGDVVRVGETDLRLEA